MPDPRLKDPARDEPITMISEIEPFRGTTRIMVDRPEYRMICQVFGCVREAIWRCDNRFKLCARHAPHYHLAEGLLRKRAKLTRIE